MFHSRPSFTIPSALVCPSLDYKGFLEKHCENVSRMFKYIKSSGQQWTQHVIRVTKAPEEYCVDGAFPLKVMVRRAAQTSVSSY